MTEFVCGFMYSSDLRNVLLLKKARPKWQAGKLNGVGGHLEDEETIFEAICREFSEETGYKGRHDWKYKVCMTVNGNAVVHFFSMIEDLDVLFPSLKGEDDEPLVLFPMSECLGRLEDLVPGLGWLLPLCADQCISSDRRICISYESGLIPK